MEAALWNFSSLILFIKVNSAVFFFEKPMQWIDFTCIIHVNVNSNFFFKKN